MAIEIGEYIDLGARLSELHIGGQPRMALLPTNIESATSFADLKNASEFATLRKLLRVAQLPLDDLTVAKLPTVKNKSIEWVAPTLYVSAALYCGNPDLVATAVNIVSSYLFEAFRGRGSTDEVKFEVVVQKQGNRTYKKVSYSGPTSGLKELPKVVKEVIDGE